MRKVVNSEAEAKGRVRKFSGEDLGGIRMVDVCLKGGLGCKEVRFEAY